MLIVKSLCYPEYPFYFTDIKSKQRFDIVFRSPLSCHFILDESRSEEYKEESEDFLKENTSLFFKKFLLTVESTFRNNDIISQVKDFIYSKENPVLVGVFGETEITFRFKGISLKSKGNLEIELEEIVKNNIGGMDDGTARIKEFLTYGQ